MKNENYTGKHNLPESHEQSRMKKVRNFIVNIDESNLKMGTEYTAENHTQAEQNAEKPAYDIENFAPGASSEQPQRRKTAAAAEEITSFSNDTAKLKAEMKNKQEARRHVRDYKKSKKEKDRNNRSIFRMFWIISCVVCGLIIAQIFLIGFNDFLAVNRTDNSKVTIEITQESDINSVAKTLKENGVINNKFYFKLFSKITKSQNDFQQGVYEISKNMDYQAIISYLQSNYNRSDIVTVQFREGMNVLEIADKLFESGVIEDKEAFLKLCNTTKFNERYTFLKNATSNQKYYRLEGYLYPDTYDFYMNEDPETVIEKFIENYETRVYYEKRYLPGRSRSITIGKLLNDSEYTADEIMIIASIIQAEALNKEDMYNISAVIHNRLEQGYDSGVATLDCDSTVYYPYRNYESLPQGMSDYVSRYDTYNVVGLPSGEICSPGAEAILAALLPSEEDYLYFCHSAATEDEPARAYYASTYSEHQYNLELAGLADDSEEE